MRQHDLEIEMDATPEQVWEAVSTSQGIASWFAPIARVEPGKGGSVTMGWSPDMEATSRIEVWEPNQQIRIVGDRPEGTPPSVVDYYIEGRGGKTVLRLVHSGFGDTANFDGEFESTGGAWPTFLKMMKHSVEQGVARCRNVTLFRMLPVSHAEAWGKLTTAIPELPKTAHGCCAVEFPERNHALMCVFCENCGGKSMLTLTWLLYGASEPEAEEVREHWTGVVDGMFAQ